MKIDVIGPLELPKAQGGVTRHCEEIYARIAADGNEVRVLCAGGPGSTTYRGLRVRNLRTARSSGWERLTYAWASSFAAFRGDADIVHYHSFASSAFCALPKLRGKKVVTTAHRIEWQDAKWGRLTRAFLKFSERAALRTSDALIAVSQALKDDLMSRSSRAERITVISNGITRAEPVPSSELEALGVRPNDYFLVVGRVVPEKGVDIAITAYLELLGRGDGQDSDMPSGMTADLVIVGAARRAGNEYEAALKRQAAPAGGRIHFLGVQPPEVVAALYDHATALLAPSYQEGQPLVVAEAMAAGCCVVASDIAAHLELLDDTATFFPAGDALALANAIAVILAAPEAARDFGARAATRIAQGDYSWDAAAIATERVLASL